MSTSGGNGSGTQGEAMTNSVVVVGGQGDIPLQVSRVSTFIDGRCAELIADYEANNNAHLNQVLAVSTNASPQV